VPDLGHTGGPRRHLGAIPLWCKQPHAGVVVAQANMEALGVVAIPERRQDGVGDHFDALQDPGQVQTFGWKTGLATLACCADVI